MKAIWIVLAYVFFSPQVVAGDCQDSVMPALSSNSQQDGEVTKYLESLAGTVLFSDAKTEGSYCQLHDWYKESKSSRRFSSRMLAVLVIVLGASLPLVGILEKTFTNQKFWVAFIGASIVVAQGFSQTFQYEESWRTFTVAKLELEGAHRMWQREIVDASLRPDGLKLAQTATAKFERTVESIVANETNGFFESLKRPEGGKQSSTDEQGS